jgi:hypothetical protein
VPRQGFSELEPVHFLSRPILPVPLYWEHLKSCELVLGSISGRGRGEYESCSVFAL